MKKDDSEQYLVPVRKGELIDTSPLISRGLDLAKNITKYKKRLLLANYDEGLLKLLEKRLSEEGYEVTAFAFEHGLDALVDLKKNNYDLLIMHLVMSEMEGTEFLEEVQRLRPGLKVVLYTGILAYGETIPINEKVIKQFGIVASLALPSTFKELLETVNNALKL